MFELVRRTEPRITIVGKVNKTTLGAQSAPGANAQPGSNAGAVVGIQYLKDFSRIGGRLVFFEFLIQYVLNIYHFNGQFRLVYATLLDS